MKVLVAEDDPHILGAIEEILRGEGYEVVCASDGRAALAAFEAERPDLVCLDIMMPELNGYDVCRAIRKIDAEVPVIFLSAKSEEVDKVLGLELGADDFISKPFGVRELVARMRAVCRRCLARAAPQQPPSADLHLGDLTVMPTQLRARRGDQLIDLSLREVRLLQTFHDNAGRVLDRDALFDAGWGVSHYPNSRTLDQQISKLRKKIEADPKEPKIIQTVHGAGYRFEG